MKMFAADHLKDNVAQNGRFPSYQLTTTEYMFKQDMFKQNMFAHRLGQPLT